MKRLEIKNFDNKAMGITSDYIDIRYSSDMGDKYVLGVSGKNHYKMAIHKVSDGDNYTIWLWDMGKNMSYPMSIWAEDVSSIKKFTRFLENMIKVADKGEFSGEEGNRIPLK